jgi:hypothetical protein
MFPPTQVYPTSNVLIALRELLSRHPSAAEAGPEQLAELLLGRRYLACRPETHEVERAVEALRLDSGEVAP